MTEKITSLCTRSGGGTARDWSRKWHGLPESMKGSTLRLLLLLGILFIPALRASAETWSPITCLPVDQELRQDQTSDNVNFAQITVLDDAWYYWEQKSKNPWDGLMHFTPTRDKKGKGYGIRFSISVEDGYRITKVIFRDTEGCGTYRNEEGIKRLDVAQSSYSKRWDETSLDNYVDPSNKNKYRDNNNMVFENTDDNPLQRITFRTHDRNGDQFKCRMIMVICKKVHDYKFSSDSYNLKVGDRVNHVIDSKTEGWNLSGKTFSYYPAGVVHIAQDGGNGYVAVADKAGETTVNVSQPSDNDYVKYSIKAKFTVTRHDQPAKPSSSALTMNAWDALDVPAVLDRPSDYTGTAGNWKSSDESIAKIQNGKIVFGGTGYGKTATFTADLPQDNKYNAKTLSFTVQVNNEIRIASKADWEQFCNQVNNLNNGGINATLTANITDPVTTSAGTSENTSTGTIVNVDTEIFYTGTFEGGGNSIALNLNGVDFASPFIADGATIRNLTVTGKITASGRFAGSLVGLVRHHAVTIEHCHSSVDIISPFSGGVWHGGLVGFARASVKINNCIFSGSMTGSGATNCGGLVGLIYNSGRGSTITNCLITANYAVSGSGSDAVAVNSKIATISNVYILNPLGYIPAGAEQVSAAQMKSGYVAYRLQSAQSTPVWGQRINVPKSDAAPLFSAEAAKKVYRVAHVSSLDDKVMQEKFYNSGQTAESLSTSSLSWYVNTYKDPTHWYEMTNAGSVSSPVSADQHVKVTVKDNQIFNINNAAAWAKFCDYSNDVSPKVSAKMSDNVTLTSASPMAGNKKAYAGKFDGGFHTLTVAYQGTAQATAPFNTVEGAVIENLRTAGTITQTGTTGANPQSHASGLVGIAKGVTINNCEVAVAIRFTGTGTQDQHSGGFVGHGQGSVIKMNNCKFSGSFSAPEGSKTSGIAGLVGWSAGTGSSFTNCYVAGTYANIVDVHPLVYTSDKITVSSSNNYYYFNGIGASTWHTYGTATPVTSDEVKSGSVTYALQHGNGAQYWSQSLPGNDEPMLAYSDAKTVNRVEFVYNGAVKITRYANKGSRLPGGAPTLKDFLGSAYNDSYYYETFTFSLGFDGNSYIHADYRITVDIKYSECFIVNSKETWEKFCTVVKKSNSKVTAKMTADITDAVTTMAGTSAHPYQGTFEGQGHTLTLNLTTATEGAGPFGYVDGATVKGLRTVGTINTSAKFAGGIVGVANNTLSTISDCQSDVTINSSTLPDATHGGIVALAKSPVSIENCAFTGTINSPTSYNCGGILGWAGAAGNTIKNCLVTGKLEVKTSVNGENSDPIARHNVNVEVSNTYYLHTPYPTTVGTQVTEEQLKNGYVASMLQAGNTDESYWAFHLGGGTRLHTFSHKDESGENQNYVYYEGDAKKWRCKNYRLTDGAAYQGSYVDFMADKMENSRSLPVSPKHGYTVCLPYEYPIGNFKAYTLVGANGNQLVFKEVADKLEAYRPYYIIPDEPVNLSGEKILVKAFDSKNLITRAGDYSLVGTMNALDNAAAANANAYILQRDNLWHKVTTKNNAAAIPAYRAYITCTNPAGAKQLTFVLDDETTTISPMTDSTSSMGDGAVYNLQGQRVANSAENATRLSTGVYIVNGKKVVIK